MVGKENRGEEREGDMEDKTKIRKEKERYIKRGMCKEKKI